MAAPVLVTFATKYGSTEEVAHAVAVELEKHGETVALLPMQAIQSLNQYGAIVLGIPLYMGHFPAIARQFLRTHRQVLTQRPVALFVLGPIHPVEEEFAASRHQAEKQLKKYPWFKPVVKVVFGGRYDPAKLGFPFNLVPALRGMPANEARDWETINEWADGLAERLRPSMA